MGRTAIVTPRNTLMLLAGLMAVFAVGQRQRTSTAYATTPALADPSAVYRQAFQAKLDQAPAARSTGAVTISSSTEATVPFPHPALYGGANSDGWPLVGDLSNTRPAPGTPLNAQVIQQYARFPYVILPATPLADSRPDIIPALRAVNPNINISAYVMGSTTWCPQDSNGNIDYASGTFFRDYWLIASNGSVSCTPSGPRFLWMRDGTLASDPPSNFGINVNLAYHVVQGDGTVTYPVAEQLADAIYTYGKASKGFNGIFIDVYCPSILWMESTSNKFDYAAAGYGSDNTDPANRAAFDAGWQAGHQRLADHLRELAVADGQPSYPISGNCGQAPARLQTALNGWMREGYPFQNQYGLAADFYSNMLAWPWGYLHQDRNFLSPQVNYIFTPTQSSGVDGTGKPIYQQYSAYNQMKMRFGLASASLGNGVSAFHVASGIPGDTSFFQWWYDEYAVNTRVSQSDPNFGHATGNAAETGWLGQALGPAYAYSVDNQNPNLLTTNTGFESGNGNQVPGWQLSTYGLTQATVQRDTTTSASGSASLRTDVTSVPSTPIPYGAQAAAGPFAVVAYQQYSVTFWAKASSELPLAVGFSAPTNGAFQTIPIDSQWRKYSAILVSSVSTLSASVQFQFATTTGSFWIDDVTVQSGTSAIWRRDFEKGIVLINPSAVNVTVNLEKTYRKISGTVNTVLNDGTRVTQVTLQGTQAGAGIGDAIFLLTIDNTPPAAVQDLGA